MNNNFCEDCIHAAPFNENFWCEISLKEIKGFDSCKDFEPIDL